jgi:hypothetical protein
VTRAGMDPLNMRTPETKAALRLTCFGRIPWLKTAAQ